MHTDHAFVVLPRTPDRPRKIGRVYMTCWHCSRAVEIDLWPLETVEDVVRHAYRAKMVAKFDDDNERVLIFCYDGCADRNKNEAGEYRKLAPRVTSRAGRIISSVYLLSSE